MYHHSLRALLMLSTAMSLQACMPYSGPVGPVSDVVVKEYGSSSSTEDCSDFRVSPAEVKDFFQRAVLITQPQMHDFYMYGPCYARGTLSSRYGVWQWEIRMFGTATLASVGGDETYLLGDPRQESSLAEE